VIATHQLGAERFLYYTPRCTATQVVVLPEPLILFDSAESLPLFVETEVLLWYRKPNRYEHGCIDDMFVNNWIVLEWK
jgi:hypothetical protein